MLLMMRELECARLAVSRDGVYVEASWRLSRWLAQRGPLAGLAEQELRRAVPALSITYTDSALIEIPYAPHHRDLTNRIEFMSLHCRMVTVVALL